SGKYIFGDFSQNFGPTGRLFYIDSEGDRSQIFEFKLGANNDPLGLFVFGFGEGEDGELYALTSTNLAPNGNGGQVFRIVSSKGDIRITQTAQTIQGGQEILDIVHDSGLREFGGFDFLIQYDPSALSFLGADEGNIYADYDWEFFTFRFGPSGNCSNGCPTGKARIIGIANVNDGAATPSSFLLQAGDVFARLRFLVSNDRTLECQFVPVRFCWFDCGDNSLPDPTGDSLYVSCFVYDYSGTGTDGPNNDRADITNGAAAFPTTGGTPDECVVAPGNGKPAPRRVVNFLNGGIKIACADEIDDIGDLNFNGLAYEIADAVMYTAYFTSGLTAFAPHEDGSVAASDVNRDGMPLTVADLVYLIRIIVGDALPLGKLAHNSQTASFTSGRGIISTDTELGAVLFEFAGTTEVGLLAENMSLDVGVVNGNTRALVYSLSGETIAAEEILLTSGELISVEAADPTGAALNAVTNVKPVSFALHQNYPNPFNPSTKITLDLPSASEWKIVIYNLNGRLVKEFSGSAQAGTVTVDWDASSVASGIYFYKAQVGNLSQTRKMALVK
ncbi:MAG: T9SS type A sorting domain-containing protein, partial [candidate division Zixibacteria bacterium]|nr:T9SS type A sorting domain-containing protein [candidate division Zixibacteria bacterium]